MKACLSGGRRYGSKQHNPIYEATTLSLVAKLRVAKCSVTSFSKAETQKQHGILPTPSIRHYITKKSGLALPRWAGAFMWYVTGVTLFMSLALKKKPKPIEASDVVVMGGFRYFNHEWANMLLYRHVDIEMAHKTKTEIIIFSQTVGAFGNNGWNRLSALHEKNVRHSLLQSPASCTHSQIRLSKRSLQTYL